MTETVYFFVIEVRITAERYFQRTLQNETSVTNRGVREEGADTCDNLEA